jgi:DNA-binding CsgD family transcriptional regulator
MRHASSTRDVGPTAPVAAPPRLEGREPELDAVRAFVDALDDGPRGLLIEGEAGIGKTAIWRAALAEAEARGCIVLRCVAEQAEARLSFVGLADLAEGVSDESLAAVRHPQREALEIALVRRERAAEPPDPAAVAIGFRSLLVRMSAVAPVVVAVDDVQWLDAATARALAFAVRRLDGQRVGVLATARTPLAGPEPLGLERALGPERLARVRLGPLGVDAVRRLVESALGYGFPRPTLLRIAQTAGGNPLFAFEIARTVGPAPALEAGAPLPVPDNLRELVAGRIAELEPVAQRTLLVAAALSHPTVELVERASSERGLIAAEESGLLSLEEAGDRVVFAHPLYASAVYTAAASGRRRELHRSLATLVADPEERVRHRALAATGADERVARELEAAAAAARGRGAWETAGELLEQARALTPYKLAGSARARGVSAAEHHIHAGDRPRARALLESILEEAPPGPTRSDALRLLAEVLYNEQGFGGVTPLLDEAAAQAGGPARAVAVELDLTYVRCNHLGDSAGADPHADRALALAAEAGDQALLAEAMAVRAMVDFLIGRGADWALVDRALALEGDSRTAPLYLRPSSISACLKLWTGRDDEAREELTALRRAANETGDESDLAYLLTWLASLEITHGDLAAGEALADEAASHAALAGSEFNRAWALTQRAMALAYRGDADGARGSAGEAAEICARFEASNPMLWGSAALAVLELSQGDPAAAWAALAAPAEAADAFEEPLALVLAPAVEALIGLGELDRAEAMLDRLQARAERRDRVWAVAEGWRCRALLLAARGELEQAHAATERALAEHERIVAPLERGRALLAQGQIARRRKQKRAARDSLEAALALFEPLGAELWAQRAREDMERLGRRRSDDLTPSEGRVAALVAQGLSNKEVAQALFVTVHTVEVHLSRVYAKLGVRSRTQLAGRLSSVKV